MSLLVIGSGNAGGDFLPYHFVFPGKKERKLENYDIEIAATQSSPSESRYLIRLDKRRIARV